MCVCKRLHPKGYNHGVLGLRCENVYTLAKLTSRVKGKEGEICVGRALLSAQGGALRVATQ